MKEQFNNNLRKAGIRTLVVFIVSFVLPGLAFCFAWGLMGFLKTGVTNLYGFALPAALFLSVLVSYLKSKYSL
jgi:hypothetical protein